MMIALKNRKAIPEEANDAPPTSVLEEQSQIASLLHAVFSRYGFELRDYSYDILRRRIRERMEAEELDSVPALKEKMLRDSTSLDKLVSSLSIGTTAMFRDPGFFLAFRRRVVPELRNLGFFRLWHAGCSTGEEVYSMAILLHEEGLYERARIYATDMNREFLERARDGIYSLHGMKEYTRNYIQSGGTASFSDYYTAGYGEARFAAELVRNVVFARHDLASEPSFHELDVILCRNVLIYFNRRLQSRTIELFRQSLAPHGILGLGDKEIPDLTAYPRFFEEIDREHKLFRKIR